MDSVDQTACFQEKAAGLSSLTSLAMYYHWTLSDTQTYGLDPETERLLKSRLGPGQVFDSVTLWKFFDEHKAALPQDVLLNDAIQVRRDVGSASVDLIVDFGHCPKS